MKTENRLKKLQETRRVAVCASEAHIHIFVRLLRIGRELGYSYTQVLAWSSRWRIGRVYRRLLMPSTTIKEARHLWSLRRLERERGGGGRERERFHQHCHRAPDAMGRCTSKLSLCLDFFNRERGQEEKGRRGPTARVMPALVLPWRTRLGLHAGNNPANP